MPSSGTAAAAESFRISGQNISAAGNLPEEIHYFMERMQGGWGAIIIVVAILHFCAPFLFLLSRDFETKPSATRKCRGVGFADARD